MYTIFQQFQLIFRSMLLHSLFCYKKVVFPPQAEYSYFSSDFRLKIGLNYYKIKSYDISVLECIGVSITSVRCL